MNRLIFREYDIRGIAEKDLTDEVVGDIGRASATFWGKKGIQKVAVGRDNRLSSDRIWRAFSQGVLKSGLDIIDVGVVPTPLLYHAIINFACGGGVMITGSHNPPEFNGFKVCQGYRSIHGQEIQGLADIIEKKEFLTGQGKMEEREAINPYLADVKKRLKLKRKLKIVFDAGNGTTGLVAPRLFKELGCEVVELYTDLDGHFPHHLPDPTIPANMTALTAKLKEVGAEVGLACDGDGDRIGAIDEKGEIIWGDKLLALFSREILSRGPAKIIFEVKCSQALVEDIKAHGGEPIMWKTGHSLIKEKMKEEKAPLAGEMSGHMFFADNYYGYDDAIFACARLLQLLSGTRERLSALVATIPSYVNTPEIRVACSDEEKFKIVEEVKKYFKSRYEIIEVDGVRILFGDGWGLVRASNTQPVIVLRFEARTGARLKEIRTLVEKKLREFPSVKLP